MGRARPRGWARQRVGGRSIERFDREQDCPAGAWRSRGNRAFTLIELLTVLAVVAILVSISFGILRGAKQRANVAKARTELAALTQALEAFKQHYGDYPQTGGATQATPVVGGAVTIAQAQSLLFNALTGVYGATNFSTRQNGPMLIELTKFNLEVALTALFGVPQGNPPLKQVVANAFLDPWGNRYLYYYKAAPIPGRPPNNQWRAPAYVLYSTGPDGAHTPPNISTGLFAGTTQTTGNNADNIYATP